jgi:transcriptional regulator with XRE-family HTH domain
MKTEKKRKARELREKEGLSIKAIAKKLNVAKSSVSDWVKDIALTEEQAKKLEQNWKCKSSYENRIAGSRVMQANYEEKRRAFKKLGENQAIKLKPLHIMGCFLYWTEGCRKNNKNRVSISNANPNILKIFILFLKKYFKIKNEDLTIWIKYYTDTFDTPHIEKYWCDILKLPESCIRKGVVNYYSTYSLKKKKGQNPYGTCTLQVNKSVRIINHIYGAIEKYSKMFQKNHYDYFEFGK